MARIVAIGTFDGVHIGHRSVLKVLRDYAAQNGHEPVAFTFKNHPLSLIDPKRVPCELTSLWEKKQLLEEEGVIPMVKEFNDELRKTTAEELMKKLRDEYDVRAMVIGYDNTFGCDGLQMSLIDYKQLGERLGVEVLTAEEIKGISSSAIRKTVACGDMEKCRRMLGRPYSITSRVVRGNGLGHAIGYATANIDIPAGAALPAPGVYVAFVKTASEGEKLPAMVNIGVHPTVMRSNTNVVEAHIINWEGDLYDREITVGFLKRLRDEKKFEDIEALKSQMDKDRQEVMALFEEISPEHSDT